MVTKPNPRESLVRGSVTNWHSKTFPSLLKYFSRSLEVTLVDKPVTYKLFPGLPTAWYSWLLERLLLDLDNDLDLNRRPLMGEAESLDLDNDLDLDRRPLTGEGESLDLDNDLDLDRRPLMGEADSRGEGDFCLLLYGILTRVAKRDRRVDSDALGTAVSSERLERSGTEVRGGNCKALEFSPTPARLNAL